MKYSLGTSNVFSSPLSLIRIPVSLSSNITNSIFPFSVSEDDCEIYLVYKMKAISRNFQRKAPSKTVFRLYFKVKKKRGENVLIFSE